MTAGKAYNSLGQIIAHGGEVSVGILLSQGLQPGQVAAIISKRYPNLPPDQAADLLSIGEAGAEAAREINELGLDQRMPLELVPINSELFGSTPLGRRLFVAAELTNGATGESVQVRQSVDPTDTIGQMLNYLQGLIDAWSDQSPDLAEKLGEEREILLDQYFLFVERRF